MKLRGSNDDGDTWTDIDHQSGLSWTAGEKKGWDVSPGAGYTWIQVYVVDCNGHLYVGINEIQLSHTAGGGGPSQCATPTAFSLASATTGAGHVLAFTSTETNPVGNIYLAADDSLVASGLNGETIKGLTVGASYKLKVVASGKTESEYAASAATAATLYRTLTPAMLSNTTPSGIASASSIFSGDYDAFQAFDRNLNTSTGWVSSSSGTPIPGWLKFQLAAPERLHRVGLLTWSSGYAPADFKIQGENEDGAWVDLITQSGLTLASGTQYWYDVPAANVAPYRDFRVYVSAAGSPGGAIAIAELTLLSTDLESPPVSATPTGFSLPDGGDGLTRVLTFTSTEISPVGIVHDASHAIVASGYAGEKVRGLVTNAMVTHLHVVAAGKAMSAASATATAATLVPNASAGADNILVGHSDRVDGVVTNGGLYLPNSPQEVLQGTGVYGSVSVPLTPALTLPAAGNVVAGTANYGNPDAPTVPAFDLGAANLSFEAVRNTNFPASHAEEGYDYISHGENRTGTFAGGGAAPTGPALALANNANGTITATVSGADAGTSNAVWSMPIAGGSWTSRATIAVNGSATITLPVGGYWCKVVSTKSGVSSTGGIAWVCCTNAATMSLQEQILQAVATTITAAGLADADGHAVVAAVEWPPIFTSWATGKVKVFPDTDPVTPVPTGINEGAYNIAIAYCEEARDLTHMRRQLLNRKSLKNLFLKNDPSLAGVASVWCEGEETQQTYFPEQLQAFKLVSPLTLKFVARETRSS